MKISTRILLGYFLIVGLAAYFVLSVFIEEVKPGVSQAMEDTLVDTANLLAELAVPDVLAGHIAEGPFARAVGNYRGRTIDARISGFHKLTPDYRVYVTDAHGIVIFDSSGLALGKDYSRWNDIYLTLEGRYGARSTRARPEDGASTVMHVAAPIRDGDRTLGVLTVAKANATVQPFIDRAQSKIRQRGAILLAAAAAIGAFFTWRLTRSVNRLRRYARDISEGRRVPLPETGNSEIAELGRALEAMREKLDGKQYVEEYVHALTHEMKSPVAAIRGAAELLVEDPPAQTRLHFIDNIRDQADRLGMIADRMLTLARLEHRQTLQDTAAIDVLALTRSVVERLHPHLTARELNCRVNGDVAVSVRGERFLLEQALSNLLDNAVDFSERGGDIDIEISQRDGMCEIRVADRGTGIPEYARDRVFDRFYSLPRPATGKRSTGLGLALVKEVALLHKGSARLEERPGGGTIACLDLPVG